MYFLCVINRDFYRGGTAVTEATGVFGILIIGALLSDCGGGANFVGLFIPGVVVGFKTGKELGTGGENNGPKQFGPLSSSANKINQANKRNPVLVKENLNIYLFPPKATILGYATDRINVSLPIFRFDKQKNTASA